jgi:hypothetical protein
MLAWRDEHREHGDIIALITSKHLFCPWLDADEIKPNLGLVLISKCMEEFGAALSVTPSLFTILAHFHCNLAALAWEWRHDPPIPSKSKSC